NTNLPANALTATVAGGTTVSLSNAAGTDGFGNEIETLTLGGAAAGTVTPVFAGVASTLPLTFNPGSTPTATDVLNSLNTIPALAGNVLVFGANGGPVFTIIFVNGLGKANVAQLTTTTTNGTTATPATLTDGFGSLADVILATNPGTL